MAGAERQLAFGAVNMLRHVSTTNDLKENMGFRSLDDPHRSVLEN